MRDLRLIGVHDDGEHLVVTDDAGEEYRLRIDDALRAAARRDRPRLGQLQIAIDNNVRPREVQAMIRAGASAEEVAARTGWDLDKIARFEGPVLAEREHIATRAQAVRLRGTNQAGAPETLAQRAAVRLTGRGVEPSSVAWDACRDAEGQWTVSAVFAAGGRERTATWWFDQAGMSVVAKNDEAKWLSEADTPAAGPVPTPVHRPTAVFDVEVEETRAERASRATTDELINSMREHSGAKNRRRGGRRKRGADAVAPPATDEELPLEQLPPPARGTHPRDEERAKGATAPEVGAESAPDAGAETDPDVGGETDPDSPDGPVAADAPSDSPAATSPRTAEAASPGATRPTPSDLPASAPADADEAADADADSGRRASTVAAASESTDGEAPRGSAATGEATGGGSQGDSLTVDGAAAEALESTDEGDGSADTGQDDRSKGRGRKGRASVPSWDDVMFGTTRD